MPPWCHSGDARRRGENVPDRAHPMHDAYVSETGMGLVGMFPAGQAGRPGAGIRVFEAGESIEL
ncbi:hypothetical protein GCM10018966_094550 [Streptomyces yanii]